MADVKWIKIVVDIFDDEKVLLIESMPDADSVLCIWFKILCLAGKVSTDGVLLLNNRIAFTDEMLATIFRRPVRTVRMALKIFAEFNMIEIVEGTITIPNWSKHQSLDQIEERRQRQRLYMQRRREAQRLQANQKANCKTNSKANGNANSKERRLPNPKANCWPIEEERDIEVEREVERVLLHGAINSSMPNEQISLTLILNDKTEYPITQQQIQEWQEIYPAVDISGELRKMKGWLLANPTKRKTKSGILRFINNWLSNQQDKGGRVNQQGGGFSGNFDIGSFQQQAEDAFPN